MDKIKLSKETADAIVDYMRKIRMPTFSPIQFAKLGEFVYSLVGGDECQECRGKGYVQVETGVIAPNGIHEVVSEKCANCSLAGEDVAGVTFSDGEFVPIEDESIMQWIAELLDKKGKQ